MNKIYVIDWRDGDSGGLCREEGFFKDKEMADLRCDELNKSYGGNEHEVTELKNAMG